MTNVDIRFRLIQRDITPDNKPNIDANALFSMNILFLTKEIQVTTLKLSEIRILTGATSNFRKLQEIAVSNYEEEPPYVDVSVPKADFISWAKTFGDTPALKVINAI